MLRSGLLAATVPALLALSMVASISSSAGAQPSEVRAGEATVTPAPSVGPGRGNGERHVPRSVSSLQAADSDTSTRADERTSRAARPALSLEATKDPSLDRIRRSIAGGPTKGDLQSGHDDPELRALREAERRLFPR